MTSTDKIIEISNATVFRGDTCVFENLSLALDAGVSTAIIGPNGAGKSTFLKLLTRELYPLHRPSSHIRIFGQENWNVWDLRAHLGIVSHDLQSHYAGHARGIDVVLSGYYSSIGTWQHQHFSDEALDKARRTMVMLGIGALEKKLFSAMSTGQQRRALLGRALINDPDTLVLDEPTSGLDLPATFQYLDTIRSLMQKGHTVILVTHHIHEIPPEVRRVVLLKDGRVVDDGDKAELLTSARLTALFGVPIRLVAEGGYYQALPGG